MFDISKCVVFCKTKEAFGGLSNMASGYPIRLGHLVVPSSEALYQACRFVDHPEVQAPILAEKNAMKAKMMSKPHRSKTRSDWDAVRVSVMRSVLFEKLRSNSTSFGDLLLSTEKRVIVERSHRDKFWGAVDEGEGFLDGENQLGFLLMEVREHFRKHGAGVPSEDFNWLKR